MISDNCILKRSPTKMLRITQMIIYSKKNKYVEVNDVNSSCVFTFVTEKLSNKTKY